MMIGKFMRLKFGGSIFSSWFQPFDFRNVHPYSLWKMTETIWMLAMLEPLL